MALQRIGSLPSLPGGNAHYLSTLAGMLAWIEKRTITSRRDFTDWVVASQDVARSSVNNYVQTLFRLGVVEKASTGDYMHLGAWESISQRPDKRNPCQHPAGGAHARI